MTDPTTKFDPIPRLQQIVATIKERGAGTFDAPATAAYYINCAINEIERLRKEAFALSAWSCREIDRITAERDAARQRTNSILTEIDCRIEHGAESNGHLEAIRSLFKENNDE